MGWMTTDTGTPGYGYKVTGQSPCFSRASASNAHHARCATAFVYLATPPSSPSPSPGLVLTGQPKRRTNHALAALSSRVSARSPHAS